MRQEKKRIDSLLVEKGYFPSREKARASLMAREVFIGNDQIIIKPGTKVNVDIAITIKSKRKLYVSRGGYKLEKALKTFSITVRDRVIIDLGASTGGFTDCLLQKGARKVYAVDVGHGQIAWSLRQDPRVVNMERTNLRYLTPADFNEIINLATADVSFISLKLVLPVLNNLKVDEVVALVKPQFEAGRGQVGKGGVVRDAEIHKEVLKNLLLTAEKENYFLKDLTFSPLKGPKGNIEYLAYLIKIKEDFASTSKPTNNCIDEVVKKANLELGK